jgi:hypothetical protein
MIYRGARNAALAAAASFLIFLLVFLAGCSTEQPADMKWAAPPPGGGAAQDDVQALFDKYAAALVAKDRDAFLSLIDDRDPAFMQRQIELFDNVLEIPYDRYKIEITSRSELDADNIIAKVEIASTYRGSFGGFPYADRAAFYLTKSQSAWSLAGDATEAALGKPRDARLEDFAPVNVFQSDRVLVFHHASTADIAARVTTLADAALPRLEAAVPGLSLPQVPITIFDSKEQIDLAFPGKWAEWTGGASRPLGNDADEGGEIVIDAQTFARVDGYEPGYNPRMIGHELAHVALFPISTQRTPPFLVEGLADFVGGRNPLILLKERIAGGGEINPSLSDLYQQGGFSSLLSTESATLAYEQADTAVAFLEERYGSGTTLSLIREFDRRRREDLPQDQLVDAVFTTVLGVGWADFERQWRQYVLSL